MTDRRPLGTGPAPSPTTDAVPPTPARAGTAADRITPAAPAADPPPGERPAGRRTLGTGPGTAP
ncbi:hypothetical protein [Streptomyces jumonjinensis]|uniref:Uncharacterized protein n=1 Tax=Streptomyces jumonjinensis TaxID=1945 RepID=A0A646KAB9_STRJU|nr:hypothetical protein [Streptomyces jumonjinensis]MQS99030.1 hypothetical protein [Streptomyces jumonjinensis]